jgi:hypothetical protein
LKESWRAEVLVWAPWIDDLGFRCGAPPKPRCKGNMNTKFAEAKRLTAEETGMISLLALPRGASGIRFLRPTWQAGRNRSDLYPNEAALGAMVIKHRRGQACLLHFVLLRLLEYVRQRPGYAISRSLPKLWDKLGWGTNTIPLTKSDKEIICERW